ncbi:MAG: glutathione S-transferase [Betaproteobacteria bacterium]|nr:glutathione S-transferase [Betaproteobacteria bacterium]
MLKLYYGPGACSFVPHAALEIIRAATGEDFEARLVKLHKGEQYQPEFKAINPDSLVPVLMVEGQPLTQIIAISQYLDARYPQLELLPKEAWARARTLSTMAWMNNTVHPAFTHIFMPQKFAEDEAARAELKRYNGILFRQHLERIAGEIAKAAPYWNGEKIGFLDLYSVVFLRWGGLAGIDPDSFPGYKAFVERVAALPPVAAALERERQPLHYFKKAA